MSEPTTLGQRIKAARTNKGFTLAQLSACLGVTNQQVGNIENRGDGISAESVFALADLLGVDARWLATGKEGAAADNWINERTLNIARAIASMPDERREALAIVLGLNIK